MSGKAISEFWKRLKTDDAMRGEFDALVTASPNVPASEVVQLGARHGLDFTADELRTTVALAAGAELSDDELEAVAGGASLAIKGEVITAFKLEIDGVSSLSYKISSPRGFGIINF